VGFLQALGLAPVPGVVVLDEMTLEVVAELSGVGGYGGAVAADNRSVWFTTARGKGLARVDPVTRTEAARMKLPRRPLNVTADERGAVVLCDRQVIVRVDPSGERIVTEATVPESTSDVVASGGYLWALKTVISNTGGMSLSISLTTDVTLLQLDPASLRVTREVPVGQAGFSGGLRAQGGVVSALVEDPPGEMREAVFDIATGEPLPDDRRIKTRGIAERDGNRWLREGERVYTRVDIASGSEEARGEVPGPRTGSAVLAHGCLWVINYRPPSKPDNEDTD
jgi:streptogramin lyase